MRAQPGAHERGYGLEVETESLARCIIRSRPQHLQWDPVVARAIVDHALQAHAESPQAMRVENAGGGRFAAMACTHAASVNGTNTRTFARILSRRRE